MRKLFTEHPSSVGETYGAHCISAWGFGVRLIGAGLACCLHGLLPFLCVTTGSRTVRKLHEGMVQNRAKANQPGAPAQSPSTLG